MQVLYIVQMYDTHTDTWSVPYFVPSVAGWKRALQDEINAPEKKYEWSKHPEQFVAYSCGEWSDHQNRMEWKGSETERENLGPLANLVITNQ